MMFRVASIVDPTPEHLDLGNVPRVSQALDSRLAQLDHMDEAHRSQHYHLTQRLFDEARPAGERSYIHARQLIGTASENYRAVLALLTGNGATPVAPYNLIRPAFESAFYALWILDPADGHERCLRALRVAVEDNRQRQNWTAELVKIPGLTESQRQAMLEPVAKSSKIYRDEAEELGPGWNRASQRVNVEQEIPKLSYVAASEPIMRHMMVAGWKQLSARPPEPNGGLSQNVMLGLVLSVLGAARCPGPLLLCSPRASSSRGRGWGPSPCVA